MYKIWYIFAHFLHVFAHFLPILKEIFLHFLLHFLSILQLMQVSTPGALSNNYGLTIYVKTMLFSLTQKKYDIEKKSKLKKIKENIAVVWFFFSSLLRKMEAYDTNGVTAVN
jgi:hypothetical protein